MIPTAVWAGSGHESIHYVPEQQRIPMLQTHLEWKKGTHSDFMSWSSSLLWVLVHGIRRKYHQMESNVHICIMDTQEARTSNMIYPARALMKAWNVKKPEDWYSAEYLACGRLEAFHGEVYTTIPLDTLESRGLYDVLPELGVERESDELHRRVERLRGQMFNSTDPAAPRTIYSAMTLGDTKPNDRFHLPMALAFVALRNRTLYDDGALNGVFENFEAMNLPAWVNDPFELRRIQAFEKMNEKLSEISEFASLLGEMCQRRINSSTQIGEPSQKPYRPSQEATASEEKVHGKDPSEEDLLQKKFNKLNGKPYRLSLK